MVQNILRGYAGYSTIAIAVEATATPRLTCGDVPGTPPGYQACAPIRCVTAVATTRHETGKRQLIEPRKPATG
jgi:hypothetical protein